MKVVAAFRDSHEEQWWALEVDVGPVRSPERSQSASWPPPIRRGYPPSTWYLGSNLPASTDSERANDEDIAHLAPASLAEW